MGRPREFDTNVALDAALDVFWSAGFEGASMEALCGAMGLAPASVYAAYGNKRELFIASVRRYMEEVSAQAIERISTPSGLAGIRSYFQLLIDAMVDGKRQWGCLITNAVVEFAKRDPELAGIFELHLARLETAFAAALVHAREQGELRAGTGVHAAGYLVAMVQGLNVLAKTRPGRESLESIVETALSGIAAT